MEEKKHINIHYGISRTSR